MSGPLFDPDDVLIQTAQGDPATRNDLFGGCLCDPATGAGERFVAVEPARRACGSVFARTESASYSPR
jgi:hypothetical protein